MASDACIYLLCSSMHIHISVLMYAERYICESIQQSILIHTHTHTHTHAHIHTTKCSHTGATITTQVLGTPTRG